MMVVLWLPVTPKGEGWPQKNHTGIANNQVEGLASGRDPRLISWPASLKSPQGLFKANNVEGLSMLKWVCLVFRGSLQPNELLHMVVVLLDFLFTPRKNGVPSKISDPNKGLGAGQIDLERLREGSAW